MTVAQWVARSGRVPLDSIFVENGSIFLASKLFVVFGDDSEGNAEAGDDVPPNKANDVGFFNGDHSLGLDPFRKVIGGC